MKKLLLLLILSFVCVLGLTACEEEPQDQEQQQEEELSKELKAGQSFLKALYDAASTSTAADYTRVGKAAECTVVWTVEVTKGAADAIKVTVEENGMYTIDVPASASSEIEYKLIATLTFDGKSTQMVYTYKVPAAKISTIAEFIAAGDTETYTTLKGVITAVNGIGSKDSFVISDATGSIFCYDKDVEVTLGDEVCVVGVLSIYQGFPQLSKPSITEVVSSNNDVVAASGEVLATTAAQIKSELADSDALIAKYAGKYLEITGYGFKNAKGYINLKATLGDTVECVNLYANTGIGFSDEHVDQKIKVYGFMRGNSAGYLTLQVQSFVVVEEELTPEQEMTKALNSLNSLTKEFSESTNVELPASNGNVQFAWELVGDALPEFAIAEGKLVVTVGEANATQTLKVTATLGELNETKEFNLKVSVVIEVTSIEDAIAIGESYEKNAYSEDKYVLVGTVTEVQNETYGNLVISDGTNSILVYGLYSADGSTRYDKMEVKPQVGDVITVKGILGKYNAAQMKNGWLLKLEVAAQGEDPAHEHELCEVCGKCVKADCTEEKCAGHEEEPTHEHDLCEECGKCVKADCTEEKCAGHEAEPSVITTIEAALTAAEGAAVELTGTISGIYQAYNSQYGNVSVYIKDEAGKEILAFRMKGEGADTLVVGDKITVTGTVTLYNEKNQIAAGCTFVMVSVHTCDYEAATCTTPATCKNCGKTTGEVSTEHNYLEGTCTVCGAVDPNHEGEAAQIFTASKTVAALITEYGWTSSTTKQTFNLDDNVTVKVNGGSNTGKAYNNDHIRIYATDTPAGTLTISVPEGYELVSVKVSAVTGTYAFLYVDGDSTDISNTSVAVSGNSVLLKSVKNGSDGKQVRVTAIEVVYKAVA